MLCKEQWVVSYLIYIIYLMFKLLNLDILTKSIRKYIQVERIILAIGIVSIF